MKHKIAFVGNSSLTMHNFRINLLRSMVKMGYDVVVIAPKDSDTTSYKSNKIRYIPISVDSKGLNPFRDIFLNNGFVNKLVIRLYRLALKKTMEVWFLNEDDRQVFLENKIVHFERTKVINGEGVNARLFHHVSKESGGKFKFLFIGRLLWDKGVKEYVGAAAILKKKYHNVSFDILGSLDAANPSAIPREYMDKWEAEGTINYLGETRKVFPYLSHASCVVLPSYREGISRVLLEASSMEKPIVATNVTGCRDIVKDGVSGFLCEVKNVESLAEAMEKILNLPKEELEKMGKSGREIVLEKFDEKIIIQEYKNKLNEIFQI